MTSIDNSCTVTMNKTWEMHDNAMPVTAYVPVDQKARVLVVQDKLQLSQLLYTFQLEMGLERDVVIEMAIDSPYLNNILATSLLMLYSILLSELWETRLTKLFDVLYSSAITETHIALIKELMLDITSQLSIQDSRESKFYKAGLRFTPDAVSGLKAHINFTLDSLLQSENVTFEPPVVTLAPPVDAIPLRGLHLPFYANDEYEPIIRQFFKTTNRLSVVDNADLTLLRRNPFYLESPPGFYLAGAFTEFLRDSPNDKSQGLQRIFNEMRAQFTQCVTALGEILTKQPQKKLTISFSAPTDQQKNWPQGPFDIIDVTEVKATDHKAFFEMSRLAHVLKHSSRSCIRMRVPTSPDGTRNTPYTQKIFDPTMKFYFAIGFAPLEYMTNITNQSIIDDICIEEAQLRRDDKQPAERLSTVVTWVRLEDAFSKGIRRFNAKWTVDKALAKAVVNKAHEEMLKDDDYDFGVAVKQLVELNMGNNISSEKHPTVESPRYSVLDNGENSCLWRTEAQVSDWDSSAHSDETNILLPVKLGLDLKTYIQIDKKTQIILPAVLPVDPSNATSIFSPSTGCLIVTQSLISLDTLTATIANPKLLPAHLTFISSFPQPAPVVPLDALPSIPPAPSPLTSHWINSALATAFSLPERTNRDHPAPSPLTEVKDQLFFLTLASLGLAGDATGLFTLVYNRAIKAIIFVSAVRVDLAFNTAVVDAAVITRDRLPADDVVRLNLLQPVEMDIASPGTWEIWRDILQVSANRCRTTGHRESCEVEEVPCDGLRTGRVKSPITGGAKTTAICSCDAGLFPLGFISVPVWADLQKHAVRVALSLLYTFPYMSASWDRKAAVERAATERENGGRKEGGGRLRRCWGCGDEGEKLLRCSRCKVAEYCGGGCQREDWKKHKGECRGIVLRREREREEEIEKADDGP